MAGIEITKLILTFGSGLTAAVIALIGNYYLVNKREKDYDEKIKRNYLMYEKKTDAILQALKFLANYIASTSEDKIALYKKITPLELTQEARECQDKLILYSGCIELIQSFDNIILKNESILSSELITRYNLFRELCKKELGSGEMKLKDDLFYWNVSTSKIK